MIDLETEIEEALRRIPGWMAANGLARSNTEWSTKVMDSLCNLAAKHRWESYANQCNTSTHKNKWLYDVVFWELNRSDSFAKGMPLAAECAWDMGDDREGDFEKLIQSRAGLRLWIVNDKDENSLRQHFDTCIKMIWCFEASQVGDKYLFVGLDRAADKFIFLPYTYISREMRDVSETGLVPEFLKKQPGRRI